jgi:hypothetical protein
MNCDELREQLPDYALGTLSEVEMAAVRRHLRGCSACRSEARMLDEGIALFASAAHATEPPPELKSRVMSVLQEEWQETPAPRVKPSRWLLQWQAVAAVVVLIAAALAWGGYSQAHASKFHEDAISYRSFLHALGGKEVRVATLAPSGSTFLEGTAILYDSDKGQSWIMVLARAPGFTQDLTVRIENPQGKAITVPFPLKFDPDGDAWTAMVTVSDISRFNKVILVAPGGQLVASGTVLDHS